MALSFLFSISFLSGNTSINTVKSMKIQNGAIFKANFQFFPYQTTQPEKLFTEQIV